MVVNEESNAKSFTEALNDKYYDMSDVDTHKKSIYDNISINDQYHWEIQWKQGKEERTQ